MDTSHFVQNHLLARSWLSNLLAPLGYLYGQAMLLRRKYLYPHPYHSRIPVISIGNLCAGGSGKTPVSIALARALEARELRVAVSHRGYKGDTEHGLGLVSDRAQVLMNAQKAGDEAFMIASSLPGIPVVAGKKRVKALCLLENTFHDLDCIIMDDTFQHLKVSRSIDIVVFDTAIGFANGRCLPAGYLREPARVLHEDVIAVFHQKPGGPPADRNLRQTLLRYSPHFFNVLSSADRLLDGAGNVVNAEVLAGKRVALVSGIAAPESFAAAVSGLDISIQQHYKYPDHYHFQDSKEIASLVTWDFLICTAKDYAKLAVYKELSDKLLILTLDTRLSKEFIDFLLHRINPARS